MIYIDEQGYKDKRVLEGIEGLIRLVFPLGIHL